jgi:Cytochrome c oxidase subunit IV
MANPEHAATPASEHEHHDAHIHLPPNSWSPINVALSLSMCFIGTLSATWVWVVGLVWLIGSLYAWFRGARTEFQELPESLGEH